MNAPYVVNYGNISLTANGTGTIIGPQDLGNRLSVPVAFDGLRFTFLDSDNWRPATVGVKISANDMRINSEYASIPSLCYVDNAPAVQQSIGDMSGATYTLRFTRPVCLMPNKGFVLEFTHLGFVAATAGFVVTAFGRSISFEEARAFTQFPYIASFIGSGMAQSARTVSAAQPLNLANKTNRPVEIEYLIGDLSVNGRSLGYDRFASNVSTNVHNQFAWNTFVRMSGPGGFDIVRDDVRFYHVFDLTTKKLEAPITLQPKQYLLPVVTGAYTDLTQSATIRAAITMHGHRRLPL